MKKFLYLLALPVLLVAGSGVAEAATCTSTAGGTWTAINSGTATWSCGTPSGADDIIIADGHTVTITSGSTVSQDGATAATGVTVQSGGELVMQAGSQLDLNVDGLDCQSGSTCTFEGTYRSNNAATTTTSLSTANRFPAGVIELCPSGACTNAVTMSYAAADYEITDGTAGATDIDTAIEAIDDTDVICWWGFDTTDKRPPLDEGFCYEITSAQGTVDPYTVAFDERQGTNSSATGYPLARRDVFEGTTSLATAKGSRQVEFAGGTFAANDYYNGRMLRFENGSGVEENTSYRIYDTVDGATTQCDNGVGPCDLVFLAPASGVQDAKASGDDVWIDYGWATGDGYYVIRPARLTSATGTVNDSPVTFDGTVSARGLVIIDTDTVALGANATVSDFTDIWLQDVADATGGQFTIQTEGSTLITRFRISGDEATRTVGQHAITVDDAGADVGPVTINGAFMRHSSDDFLSVSGASSTARDNPLTVTDFRGQFAAPDGDTMGCLKGMGSSSAIYPPNFSFTATNVECIDATRDGDAMIAIEATGTNFVMIANEASFRSNKGGARGSVRNLYGVGNVAVTNTALFPMTADRFVWKDATSSDSTSAMFEVSSGDLILSLKNGYFVDAAVQTGPVTNPQGIIENVGFFDFTGSTGNWLGYTDASTYDAGDTMTVRNVTYATDPQGRSYAQGQSGEDFDGIVTYEYNAFTLNTDGGGAIDDRSTNDTIGLGENQCFFDNAVDVFDETNIGTGVVRAKPPNFVAPEIGRYDVRAGSPWDEKGCGIKRNNPPGICSINRAMGWSNLEPECMGDAKGGGGGGGSFAPSPFGG